MFTEKIEIKIPDKRPSAGMKNTILNFKISQLFFDGNLQ
jgi:hypothetical protein